MFCPRCGRPVNENANFCGGCGMPKADIIKYLERQRDALKTPEIPPVEDLTSHVINTVADEKAADDALENDYTTEEPENTNDFVSGEMSEDTYSTYTDFSRILDEDTQPEQPEEARPISQPQDWTVRRQSYRSSGYNYSQPQLLSTDTAEAEEDKRPLETSDFLWMMIISGIPVVGLFYLIYQAISGKNKNKRSYARATLIFSIYAFVLAVVFVVGALFAFM